MIGLDASTFFSICVSAEAPPTMAKYRMAYLALTVFPAPLSPLTIIDWLRDSLEQHDKPIKLLVYHLKRFVCKV